MLHLSIKNNTFSLIIYSAWKSLLISEDVYPPQLFPANLRKGHKDLWQTSTWRRSLPSVNLTNCVNCVPLLPVISLSLVICTERFVTLLSHTDFAPWFLLLRWMRNIKGGECQHHPISFRAGGIHLANRRFRRWELVCMAPRQEMKYIFHSSSFLLPRHTYTFHYCFCLSTLLKMTNTEKVKWF